MSALWLLSGLLVGFGAAHVTAAEPFWVGLMIAGCIAAAGAAGAQRDQN